MTDKQYKYYKRYAEHQLDLAKRHGTNSKISIPTVTKFLKDLEKRYTKQ